MGGLDTILSMKISLNDVIRHGNTVCNITQSSKYLYTVSAGF